MNREELVKKLFDEYQEEICRLNLIDDFHAPQCIWELIFGSDIQHISFAITSNLTSFKSLSHIFITVQRHYANEFSTALKPDTAFNSALQNTNFKNHLMKEILEATPDEVY